VDEPIRSSFVTYGHEVTGAESAWRNQFMVDCEIKAKVKIEIGMAQKTSEAGCRASQREDGIELTYRKSFAELPSFYKSQKSSVRKRSIRSQRELDRRV
jgi:hypothetical protein